MCSVGQKFLLGFSIRCARKPEQHFWPAQYIAPTHALGEGITQVIITRDGNLTRPFQNSAYSSIPGLNQILCCTDEKTKAGRALKLRRQVFCFLLWCLLRSLIVELLLNLYFKVYTDFELAGRETSVLWSFLHHSLQPPLHPADLHAINVFRTDLSKEPWVNSQ